MAEIVNVVIIGGGVIGAAIAAEVSRFAEDVFLLEALPRLGLGTSTRNSGVIHRGIYYKAGSLKAVHCVRGVPMLYEFCAKHGVPHQRIGKLIVADSEDHLPQLEDLIRRAELNGVDDLRIIDSKEIQRIEPNIASPIAIHSPNTGIVEAEELVKALAREAQSNGAHILTNTKVIGAEVVNGITTIRTEREEVQARVVINSAGLFSDEVARMFGYDKHTVYPCRGEYAEIIPSRSHLVNGLVYPLPMPTGHGLGVHFTRTTGGTLQIGPNARYRQSKDDYESDRTPLEEHYELAKIMCPSLRLEDLRLSYTGIRPRLTPEHVHTIADWVIEHDPRFPQVIHLIGIESPGLTACLSIGQSVADMVRTVL